VSDENHGWAIIGDGYYAEATKGADTVCIQDGILTVTEDVGSGHLRQTSTVHICIEALTALLARAGLALVPATATPAADSNTLERLFGAVPDMPLDDAREAQLQAQGFEPVSEEQREQNRLVNLGVAIPSATVAARNVSDERDWPDGWRWYRNPPSHGGEPYLAHPHDCELTLDHIRRLVAFHGLALVPIADVPTPEERAVLMRVREMCDAWQDGERVDSELVLVAELARRAAKEAKGG
jgi:hypothetical protein